MEFPAFDAGGSLELANAQNKLSLYSTCLSSRYLKMFIIITSFPSILWTLYYNHPELLSCLQISSVLCHPWGFAHTLFFPSLGFFLHHFHPTCGLIKSSWSFRPQSRGPFFLKAFPDHWHISQCQLSLISPSTTSVFQEDRREKSGAGGGEKNIRIIT